MTITLNNKKETEKAINSEVLFYIDGTCYTWLTWLPKSRINKIDEHHYEVEDWLMKKFEQDIANNHPSKRIAQNAKIGCICYNF